MHYAWRQHVPWKLEPPRIPLRDTRNTTERNWRHQRPCNTGVSPNFPGVYSVFSVPGRVERHAVFLVSPVSLESQMMSDVLGIFGVPGVSTVHGVSGVSVVTETLETTSGTLETTSGTLETPGTLGH